MAQKRRDESQQRWDKRERQWYKEGTGTGGAGEYQIAQAIMSKTNTTNQRNLSMAH